MARDPHKTGSNSHDKPHTAPFARNKPSSSSSQSKVKPDPNDQRQPVASSSTVLALESIAEAMGNRKQKNKRKRSRSRDASSQREQSLPTRPETPTEDDVYNKYAKLKRSGTKFKSILSPLAKTNGAESSTSSPIALSSPKVKVKSEATNVDKPKENFQVQILERRIQNMKAESEKEVGMLNARVAELEKEAAELRGADGERNKIVQEHNKLQNALTEAVNCHICFEPFNDPHILTCGHVACKGCFVSYFRSPAAYFYPMETVPANKDLSHFRKMCHICRDPVIHRPVRMYGLRNILEALGIDGHMPSPSQSRAERLATRSDAEDPWHLSFPEEKDDYRQYDDNDDVYRCRDCWGEVDGDQCAHCGNLFSEHGSHAGDEDDMGLLGSDEDDIVALLSEDDDNALAIDTDDDASIQLDLVDAANRIARNIGRLQRRGQRRQRVGRDLSGTDDELVGSGDEIQDAGAVRRRFRAIMRGDEPRARRGPGNGPRVELSSEEGHSSDEGGIQGYLRHRRQRRDHLLDLIADDDRLGDGGDYPEDPDSEDETYSEEEYENSFIDDNEVLGGIDGNTTGSSDHSGSDVEVLEVDDDVDEPIFVAPARGRNRRRVYEDPDEDDSDDL